MSCASARAGCTARVDVAAPAVARRRAGARRVRILGVLFAFLPFLAAAPPSAARETLPYDDTWGSPLLFLHPLVNYALPIAWLDTWQRGLLARTGFLGNFGSVATHQLLVDAGWVLNHDLGGGWRFRNEIRWRETRHLAFDSKFNFLGLERQLVGPLGLMLQCDPAFDKEELDLRLGALAADEERANYLQLLYVIEDLAYDEKNAAGGESLHAPRGLDWLLRLERGRWALFSAGRWSGGWQRRFADPLRSPVLAEHERRRRQAELRLRGDFAPRWQLELTLERWCFEETKAFRDSTANYRFEERTTHGALRALFPAPDQARWQARLELHQLWQAATGEVFETDAYCRLETMPAAFALAHLGAHRLELGYLASLHRWERSGRDRETGYADKVKLGYLYAFAEEAWLQLSLSHELSLDKFGGGSLQFLTQF